MEQRHGSYRIHVCIPASGKTKLDTSQAADAQLFKCSDYMVPPVDIHEKENETAATGTRYLATECTRLTCRLIYLFDAGIADFVRHALLGRP